MLVTLGTQRVNLWRTMTHKARKNPRTLIKWSLHTDLKPPGAKLSMKKERFKT